MLTECYDVRLHGTYKRAWQVTCRVFGPAAGWRGGSVFRYSPHYTSVSNTCIFEMHGD